ncbi:MAG: DNA-directed RNA polymerase subunit omega [Phycisphaerae bacterium]|nr:DNA-directed RNA polymerase subunit omega [Phycisphaerae bacterium]
MIENLKSDDIIEKVGGRFKLTALIQKRWLELMRGEARPMVDPAGRPLLEVVVQEILEGKVTIDYAASDLAPPKS